MPRALAGLLTAVVAALALAACGGSDETTTADYRKDYAPISAAIRGLGTEVGGAVTTAKDKSDIELQEQFADLADRANVVADDLAQAQAPDDAAITAARDELVAGVRKAAGDLDAISAAAAAGDAKAAKAATIRLASDSAAIRDPRRKLDQLVLSSN
ncbi:MAG TPA: hypothetical protein PKD63_08640 [Solirubrobacteraceae bacterium]|nr:hypothetical protein [Solirubrobacteraceae bacterium]